MANIVAVLLDGVAQLEFDREQALPDHQAEYLDKMDKKMDQGIFIDGETINEPTLSQRAQFVAGNLASALLEQNHPVAMAMCSYLATRLEDLKQVKIKTEQDISIELVFDEEYQKQVAVKFFH